MPCGRMIDIVAELRVAAIELSQFTGRSGADQG